MKLEYFIAKRLITAKDHKSSISAPIIKIAIAAIAIGMIMMIVSVATGVGLQRKIREKIAAFSGHVIISNYDDNQSQVSTTPLSINQEFYPKFKNVEGISHIQAVVTKAGIIRTENSFEGIIFKGVGLDYNWNNLREYLVKGRLPNLKASLNQEVLISQYISNRLNITVGSKFNTFFMKENHNGLPNLRRFKVVGIYNSGFQEFDATYIFGDIRHLQLINHWKPNQIGVFEVFIDNFDDIKLKGNQIYKATTSTLDTKTILEKYRNIFEWLELFDFNIITILIIMTIVASINMVVALLVLILERTQMIGVLKAIGANNWIVRRIFIYNAFYLIVKGLFWGNLIGLLILYIQLKFSIIKLPPENYYVSVAPVYIEWQSIFFLNIGTIVICLLVLLIPSYLVTKISPVKAIRFD